MGLISRTKNWSIQLLERGGHMVRALYFRGVLYLSLPVSTSGTISCCSGNERCFTQALQDIFSTSITWAPPESSLDDGNDGMFLRLVTLR
jgi:hypothetical protein